MRISFGLGLGKPGLATGPAMAAPPSLALSLWPSAPAVGDLVILTGVPGGNPAPAAFAMLSVTIGGAAVPLVGTGLVRTFVARAGTLGIAASASAGGTTVTANASVSIAAGVTLSSVIGFGSSTMDGDGASSTATRALNLIAGALGAGTIRNQAQPGTVLQNSADAGGSARSGNGRDRFASALLGANRSDRVCILYGANDLRYTGAPATFSLAGFATDLREVLNGLLTGGYARGDIAVGSPNWYPDSTYSVGSAGFTGSNRTIHESYVAECAAIAAEYGVLYADIYGRMRDLGGPGLMSGDGLHCNDAGHQVVAHAFLSAAQTNARAAVTLGAASGGVESLSLAWAETPGATGYEVEHGAAGSYAFGDRRVTSGASLDLSDLTQGPRFARIRAVFGDGAGPWAFWPSVLTVTGAVAGGGDATITGSDDFTADAGATVLSALTADVGAWTMHPSNSGDAATINGGGALRGPTSRNQFCIGLVDAAPVLPAGVFVEMDVHIRTNNAQLTSYAVARCSTTSLTFLAAGYNGSAWRILKYVAGAVTVVDSYPLVESAGATPMMRFEATGGEQRLYRNGELVLTTTIADSALGTPGEGLGLRMGAGNTGWSSTTGAQVTAIRTGRIAG